MSNPYFQFKQFTVYHDKCAMKVGTDGVLLGAWAPFLEPKRILDVGTGSGLLALMMAQRFPTAMVTAIDIDPDAVNQAKENVSISPFFERIEVENISLQDFCARTDGMDTKKSPDEESLFDAIVCNPPFFEAGLLSDDISRMNARHSTTLTFEELTTAVAKLLKDGGMFAVVLPYDAFQRFHSLCFACGMNLAAKCMIRTSQGKTIKRIMGCFRKGNAEAATTTLQLMDAGKRSEEYGYLLRDFYLDKS